MLVFYILVQYWSLILMSDVRDSYSWCSLYYSWVSVVTNVNKYNAIQLKLNNASRTSSEVLVESWQLETLSTQLHLLMNDVGRLLAWMLLVISLLCLYVNYFDHLYLWTDYSCSSFMFVFVFTSFCVLFPPFYHYFHDSFIIVMVMWLVLLMVLCVLFWKADYCF